MKKIIFGLILASAPSVAATQQTYAGVITDTMCGKTHGMMAGQPDDKCIAMCVKGSSSQYALFDGKDVLRLSDQKRPAKLASQRVKVTGTMNAKTKTIKVESIQPDAGVQ
jgi:hypothetical protein